jgi:hypothetical protein
MAMRFSRLAEHPCLVSPRKNFCLTSIFIRCKTSNIKIEFLIIFLGVLILGNGKMIRGDVKAVLGLGIRIPLEGDPIY